MSLFSLLRFLPRSLAVIFISHHICNIENVSFSLLASSSMFPKLFSSNNPNKNNFANTNNEHISMHFFFLFVCILLDIYPHFTLATYTQHIDTTFGSCNNILIPSLLLWISCKSNVCCSNNFRYFLFNIFSLAT